MINVFICAHFNPVQVTCCFNCSFVIVVKYITNIYFGSGNSLDVFMNIASSGKMAFILFCT